MGEPLPTSGWYEDPDDASKVRWWDGQTWTDHRTEAPTSTAGQETSSPPATAAPAEPDTPASSADPQANQAPTESASRPRSLSTVSVVPAGRRIIYAILLVLVGGYIIGSQDAKIEYEIVPVGMLLFFPPIMVVSGFLSLSAARVTSSRSASALFTACATPLIALGTLIYGGAAISFAFGVIVGGPASPDGVRDRADAIESILFLGYAASFVVVMAVGLRYLNRLKSADVISSSGPTNREVLGVFAAIGYVLAVVVVIGLQVPDMSRSQASSAQQMASLSQKTVEACAANSSDGSFGTCTMDVITAIEPMLAEGMSNGTTSVAVEQVVVTPTTYSVAASAANDDGVRLIYNIDRREDGVITKTCSAFGTDEYCTSGIW